MHARFVRYLDFGMGRESGGGGGSRRVVCDGRRRVGFSSQTYSSQHVLLHRLCQLLFFLLQCNVVILHIVCVFVVFHLFTSGFHQPHHVASPLFTYACTHIHTYTCTHIRTYTCIHIHTYTNTKAHPCSPLHYSSSSSSPTVHTLLSVTTTIALSPAAGDAA